MDLKQIDPVRMTLAAALGGVLLGGVVIGTSLIAVAL